MIERIIVIAILTSICFTGQGCIYQSWYEGLRDGQRQECHTYINSDEIQKCLDSIGNMTYEQYLKSREKSEE